MSNTRRPIKWRYAIGSPQNHWQDGWLLQISYKRLSEEYDRVDDLCYIVESKASRGVIELDSSYTVRFTDSIDGL